LPVSGGSVVGAFRVGGGRGAGGGGGRPPPPVLLACACTLSLVTLDVTYYITLGRT
jgi:hypothetical protein